MAGVGVGPGMAAIPGVAVGVGPGMGGPGNGMGGQLGPGLVAQGPDAFSGLLAGFGARQVPTTPW